MPRVASCSIQVCHPKEFICLERLQAEKRVATAIQEVYRLRDKHKTAEESKTLDAARTEQRAAQRALEAHINQHGCREFAQRSE